MARVPMVTRTIVSTLATVMAVDLNNGETHNKQCVVARTYSDDEALLKAVKKEYEVAGEIAIVKVISSERQEALYGMKESDFIAHAELLPPRSGAED